MIFWDQTLLELFRKGGFAMWPLLACSVVGLAIILEKALYCFRLRLDYGRFTQKLRRLLADGGKKDALILCRRHANPVPRIAEHYLKNLDDDFKRNEILKREGSFALEKIESRLRALAAVTHLAPLLGLLGTVTGLVTAFHRIEILGGQVQPGDLAAGIWEALITTVFGLVIAIPCMAAYHGFESWTDRIARRMQFVISELDEFFGKRSAGNFSPPPTEATEQAMRAMQ
jgi:biopolymer transport protein ExbB